MTSAEFTDKPVQTLVSRDDPAQGRRYSRLGQGRLSPAPGFVEGGGGQRCFLNTDAPVVQFSPRTKKKESKTHQAGRHPGIPAAEAGLLEEVPAQREAARSLQTL